MSVASPVRASVSLFCAVLLALASLLFSPVPAFADDEPSQSVETVDSESTDTETEAPESTEPEAEAEAQGVSETEPTGVQAASEPVTADPSVSVSKTNVSSDGATTVTVTGVNFDPSLATGSRPPLSGKPGGVYVAFGKFAQVWEPSKGSSVAPSSSRVTGGQPASLKWAVSAGDMATIGGPGAGAIELKPDGSFTAEIVIDKAEIDAKATAANLVNYGIYTYPGSGAVQSKYETYTPITFISEEEPVEPEPEPEPEPGTPSKPTAVGSLTWGVKASFREYVTGNIAKGSIAIGAGATGSGGAIRFTQTSSNATEPDGVGRTSYRGTVVFSGHGGELNLRIANPEVRIESRNRGTLVVSINGTRTNFATLDLSRASKSGLSYSRVPATLTAVGARAFNGFYGAGESLDPVSFVIGADGNGGGGAIRTIASAPAADDFTPPAEPPATTGLEIEGGTDAIAPGDVITASADGFEPNETDIAVVVYSTPVVLEKSLTADARGRANWTGPLPKLEPGEHTLTFQGSVNRGVTFTVVADEAAAIGVCPVEDASFSWGVKESFRSYISGSIANGDWSTDGNASYETPVFTFASGSGDFNAADVVGEIGFEGSINFTGHSGALDVTLADPVLKFVDSDTAYLVLDATSASMEEAMAGDAEPTTTEDVPFVELDLSDVGLTVGEDGTITVTGIPTALTSQGEAVFSNYEAGAAFDPIDLTIETSGDCAAAAGEESTDVAQAAADGGTSNLAWWLAGAAGLLALALGVALVRSRRGVTE